MVEPLKKILVPTDFSGCAEFALFYALDLAKRLNAELHLLHVIIPSTEDQDSSASLSRKQVELKEPPERIINDFLASTIAAHGAHGLHIQLVKQRSMAVGRKIIAYAEEQDIGLIIMGTHGRCGVKHLFLGSVAEEVIHRAHCDVFTVHAHIDSVAGEVKIHRILVPIDFSEQAPYVIRRAGELANFYHAELDLLHIVEPAPWPIHWAGLGSIYDLVPDIRDQAVHLLTHLIQEIPEPHFHIGVHVDEGRPVSKIIEFATNRCADLIVLAAHGYSGVERFFIGSVTERIVRTAPCPVLSIRNPSRVVSSKVEEEYLEGSVPIPHH